MPIILRLPIQHSDHSQLEHSRVIFELYNDTAPKTSEKYVTTCVPSILTRLTLLLHSFRALCTGEKGLSPLSHTPLYYKNCIIHRSIKDFMIQGGGTLSLYWPYRYVAYAPMKTSQNVTVPEASPSMVGRSLTKTSHDLLTRLGTLFARRENVCVPDHIPRLLCMANKGPNTNNSQFFVTLRECPHLNGTHTYLNGV